MKKNIVPIFLIFSSIALTSCSLKYSDTVSVDERIPEFIFEGTKIVQCENNKVTVELETEYLEQYKDSPETYAKNIDFRTYDDKNEITTEGSCGYLFANTDKEVYELYDEIKVFNHSEKINFFARLLKWNAKTEQLTGGKNDTVRIEKEDTVIYGSGFSASGISKTYTMNGSVSGDIDTK